MKKDRDLFVNGMIPFNPIPTNMMMYPNYMNDGYNTIENRISALENRMKSLENRITRLENQYQGNYMNPQYQTSQSGNFNGNTYTM